MKIWGLWGGRHSDDYDWLYDNNLTSLLLSGVSSAAMPIILGHTRTGTAFSHIYVICNLNYGISSCAMSSNRANILLVKQT